MSEAKHTPGEWKIAGEDTPDVEPFVYAPSEDGRCNRMYFKVNAGWLHSRPGSERTSREEVMAVARLCRAAPDLLKALQRAVDFIGQSDDYTTGRSPGAHGLVQDLSAAIAKATGQ
jgi:hypothetical protein